MSMLQRVIGPAAEFLPGQDEVRVDFGALLRRLVLFDTFILDSTRLKEVPYLVAALGYEGTIELLSSGCLRFYCSGITVGQIGQSTLEERLAKGLLPLGSYSFAVIRQHNYQEYVSTCFRKLPKMPGVSEKQFIKLKGAVAAVLEAPPQRAGEETLSQLKQDLMTNSPAIKPLVARSLRDQFGIRADAGEFQLTAHQIDGSDFRTVTDIGERYGLDVQQVHNAVERALLALGGLNQTIEEMKTYSALSGFLEDEISVFSHRLNFLVEAISPGAQEHRMERVLTIKGMGDVDPAEGIINVDVHKLLEIRQSRECQEFREWLRNTDTASDAEIQEMVTGLNARLSSIFHGRVSRTIRFLLGAATDFVSGVPPGSGLATGILDSFLFEKVIPRKGPVVFINNLYPSIFKPRRS